VNPLVILTFLANPFQWVLEQLTRAFSSVPVTAAIGSFGLSVIVLTIAIRAVLFPIFGWQLSTSRRIQAEQRQIAPQLSELRKKYKGQPQKLSAEMNKLYREHGISPFSGLTGCLPLLVQMPVLFSLYNAIRAATSHLTLGDKGFLWISDVSQTGGQACCTVTTAGHATTNWGLVFSHPAILLLPLLAAGLTFVQSRMMMPPLRADMSDQERSMANVTKQMSIIFPVLIFIFSLNFPQGLALYWVTGTLFMVVQQYYKVGWGSLRVPSWMPGADRVTPLSYPRTAPAPALVSANGGKNRGSAGGSEKTATPARAMAGARPAGRQYRNKKRRRR